MYQTAAYIPFQKVRHVFRLHGSCMNISEITLNLWVSLHTNVQMTPQSALENKSMYAFVQLCFVKSF